MWIEEHRVGNKVWNVARRWELKRVQVGKYAFPVYVRFTRYVSAVLVAAVDDGKMSLDELEAYCFGDVMPRPLTEPPVEPPVVPPVEPPVVPPISRE